MVRNPLCDFSATMDDIRPGARLIGYFSYSDRLEYYTVIEHWLTKLKSGVVSLRDINGHVVLGFLGDMGVAMYSDDEPRSGEWDAYRFCVVDTPSNRLRLVKWLLDEGSDNARAMAQSLIIGRLLTTEIVTPSS